MLIDDTISDAQLGELAFSLKPPKFVRRAVKSIGSAIAKVAPIVSTAIMFVPGAGTAVGAAAKAIGIGAKVGTASKVVTAAKTASKIITAAKAAQALLPRSSSAAGGSTPAIPAVPGSPQTRLSPLARVLQDNREPLTTSLPGRIRAGVPIGSNPILPISFPGVPGRAAVPPSLFPILPITRPGTGGRATVPPSLFPILPISRPGTGSRGIVPMGINPVLPSSLPGGAGRAPVPGDLFPGMPYTMPDGSGSPAPGRTRVSLEPGPDNSPISLVPPGREELIRDAAARVLNLSTVPPTAGSTGMPVNAGSASAFAPTPAMPVSMTPAEAADGFPWLPVLAIGGGLLLLAGSGRKRGSR